MSIYYFSMVQGIYFWQTKKLVHLYTVFSCVYVLQRKGAGIAQWIHLRHLDGNLLMLNMQSPNIHDRFDEIQQNNRTLIKS